jgi:hypothetical protein
MISGNKRLRQALEEIKRVLSTENRMKSNICQVVNDALVITYEALAAGTQEGEGK